MNLTVIKIEERRAMGGIGPKGCAYSIELSDGARSYWLHEPRVWSDDPDEWEGYTITRRKGEHLSLPMRSSLGKHRAIIERAQAEIRAHADKCHAAAAQAAAPAAVESAPEQLPPPPAEVNLCALFAALDVGRLREGTVSRALFSRFDMWQSRRPQGTAPVAAMWRRLHAMYPGRYRALFSIPY